jgi:predicted TIM-barrel fold metal-dependent hydrolase
MEHRIMADKDDGHFLSVRPDWLARRVEEILDPELPIIDPHHHLWDFPGWRYLFPDLLADLQSGHNIRQTVFVQCFSMYRVDGPRELRSLGETEFVNGVAAMSASGGYGDARACTGIVGMVDLRLGSKAADVLSRHVAAGGGRFKGVRQIAAWDADEQIRSALRAPPPDLFQQPEFRRGFACLEAADLSFDVWAYHTQLDQVLDLARAFPGTRIVLDHVGGPIGIARFAGRRDEVYAGWSRAIGEIAGCANVVVKLGGLAMRLGGFSFHRGAEPPSSEELAAAWRPYVDRCIQLFGPARCMFESNFPVDKGSCSYAVLWNAFKRLAAGYSAEEKAALFSETARTAYRLPPH